MGRGKGITEGIEAKIYEEISRIPVIDIHTHVQPGRPHAVNLYDIVSYHFVLADLEAVGLPREDWQKEELSDEEKVAKTIPFFQKCRNTGTFRCLENLLTDLYGIQEPLSPGNWEKTYQLVKEKGNDSNWANKLLKEKANLSHIVVDYASRVDKPLLAPELFSYTRERDALVWKPDLLTQLSQYLGGFPSSASEIERGVESYIDEMVPEGIKSVTVGAPITFRVSEPSLGEVNRILLHDGSLNDSSQLERLLVLSYIIHASLRIYQERKVNVVLSLGARWKCMQGKAGKTTSTFDPETLFQIGNLAASYPGIKFFVLLCTYLLNQDLSLLAKMQPNIIPTGYWWHAMYPEYIGRMLSERLDVIPYSEFVGFFSDAYIAEWVYGKLSVVRKETARVLAEKVHRGYYSEELAVEIARAILFENPKRLYLGEDIS